LPHVLVVCTALNVSDGFIVCFLQFAPQNVEIGRVLDQKIQWKSSVVILNALEDVLAQPARTVQLVPMSLMMANVYAFALEAPTRYIFAFVLRFILPIYVSYLKDHKRFIQKWKKITSRKLLVNLSFYDLIGTLHKILPSRSNSTAFVHELVPVSVRSL
jgi:hypothetical protein